LKGHRETEGELGYGIREKLPYLGILRKRSITETPTTSGKTGAGVSS